jgi:hypothetical protein
MDDYNNLKPLLPIEKPWGPSYAALANDWQDVTLGGLCDSTADQCVFKGGGGNLKFDFELTM